MSLRVGRFTGEFATTMWANDFDRFLVEARQLNETLEGSADFQTTEEQRSLWIRSVAASARSGSAALRVT